MEAAKRPTHRDLQNAALEREFERNEKQKIANAKKARARKEAGIVSKAVPVHMSHKDFFEGTLMLLFKKHFALPAMRGEADWVKVKIDDVLTEILKREGEQRADKVIGARPTQPDNSDEGDNENSH